ncbi:DUF4419 domain-containing protein [Corallococcus macrosporus]|uniref:DUF4419 domain-containing protein n=1 Tax=Myxococcus fulvus (strain ATCC BAA-855 / HW-1) TaxID=483219 RepID=F8C8U3_MYXFH|nr:DUF4419 domain-containing protein [Corallococcus macrosporus]AEI63240.1 hypothetical protein LILAB_06615 [Corallococcus macrosporus]
MLTFEVDAVEEASTPPVTAPLGTFVKDALWMAPGPDTRVLETQGVHPLLAAVHTAFSEHRPLVLSPDVIWLTMAQGVAQHIRLNAEALQGRLVRHEGRKKLTVEVDRFPATDAEFLWLLLSFRSQLREALGPGLPRLLSCDFSTSTDIERMAGDVVLMDAMSPYFDYEMLCVCGIPRITLLGTPEDWRSIRRRIDVIQELDLAWWTSSLVPIADAFVSAVEGNPDREYWKQLYKPKAAYGVDLATGWMARLFPYVATHGAYTERNPLLSISHAEVMASRETAPTLKWDAPRMGVALKDVPANLSSVALHVETEPVVIRETWTLEAGVLSVEVDGAGALLPRAGVVVRRGDGRSLMELVERILAEHTGTRATRVGAFSGAAELNALYDQLQEATLFSGGRAWRLRPCSEHAEVRIPIDEDGRARTAVLALVDLPDGSVLAWRDGEESGLHCVVQLDPRQWEPVLRPNPDAIHGWTVTGGRPGMPLLRTQQRAAEVPVVGTSLVTVLMQALEHGGSTDLPTLGMLGDRLLPWELSGK